MLLQSISLILLLAVSFAEKISADFCDPKWCPHQGKHIACNNTGEFGSECSGSYWLEDLQPYQKLILDMHNAARNKLALGNLPPYKPSCRMPTLKWDNNLAFMAELNVKTCHFEHDECRSTSEFPYSGQNIYFAQTTFNNYTTEDYIKEAGEMWFVEHEDANMDVMTRFRTTEPQSGHFTAMMLDRNDRVGCGYLQTVLSRSKKKPLIKVIFCCNYPSTNIIDFPTYLPGPAASCCSRPNCVYKGLCSEEEIIDPNDFDWYFE